ncbi:hypothetical protein TIFTF001_033687 [Ficus carica]|uniref:Uncharacterized protein n=1 Tax=Ficus carica TaxID=3494 RepID=A0AA88DZ82_FICCA|nr:hypothetical protein TIFTF001_033687 [Ficus carica]
MRCPQPPKHRHRPQIFSAQVHAFQTGAPNRLIVCISSTPSMVASAPLHQLRSTSSTQPVPRPSKFVSDTWQILAMKFLFPKSSSAYSIFVLQSSQFDIYRISNLPRQVN